MILARKAPNTADRSSNPTNKFFKAKATQMMPLSYSHSKANSSTSLNLSQYLVKKILLRALSRLLKGIRSHLRRRIKHPLKKKKRFHMKKILRLRKLMRLMMKMRKSLLVNSYL